VKVQFQNFSSIREQEDIRKRLLKLGVLDVQKESLMKNAIKESKVKVQSEDINESIKNFVQTVAQSLDIKKQKKEWQEFLMTPEQQAELIEAGQKIANSAASPSTPHSGTYYFIFSAILIIFSFGNCNFFYSFLELVYFMLLIYIYYYYDCIMIIKFIIYYFNHFHHLLFCKFF
jgi:hypothetical protein